jgi:hypothetical protein
VGSLLAAQAGCLATCMRGDGDAWLSPHRDSLGAYPRLACLSADQPILLLELGVTRDSLLRDRAAWSRRALDDVLSGRGSRPICFSWWSETCQNDDHPAHDTDMQLQGIPELALVSLERMGESPHVLGRFPRSPSWPAH